EVLGGSDPASALRQHAEAEADVGVAADSGEQPAVAGKASPWGRLPQHDVGYLDGVIDVGTQREAPQHPRRVDQTCGLGDLARGTVSTYHDITTQALATRQDEAVQGRVVEEGLGGASNKGFSPGGKG